MQSAGSATSSATERSRPEAWRVPEGAAQRGTTKFRDPPFDEARASLRTELARVLVGAREVPVDLQLFGLRLVDVDVAEGVVSLVIGSPDPIAALRLGPKPVGALVALGTAAASPVSVTVHALHAATAGRFARELEVMRSRVAASLTPRRWESALPLVHKLERLKTIPVEHLRQLVPGTRTPEGLVRTGFRCNQDCGLCWQGRDWGGYGASQILTWIEDLREAGAEGLSISGGEPTLDGSLASYIQHARALGFQRVMLQTNAIQFAKPGYAEQMLAAGLELAFVSLHSGDPAVSDAITRAPGTHRRTVLGVQRLLEAGITVDLNCVMTPESLPTLAALPEFVHASFGAHPKLLGLVLTVPVLPFDRALVPAIVPDPADLRVQLRAALESACELGVRIHDLDGPCGPQLCAFGADPRFASLDGPKAPLEFRQYLPACASCAVRSACFGVRTEQIERYGEDCVQPIDAWPANRIEAIAASPRITLEPQRNRDLNVIFLDFCSQLFGQEGDALLPLHWGFWPTDKAAPAIGGGAYDPQRAFSENLLAYIPEGVSRILDVGCGLGANAKLLSARHKQVTALSPVAHHCAVIANAKLPGVDVRCSRFEHLVPEPYELLLFSESVNHFSLEDEFLQHCRKFLTPSGFMLMADDLSEERARRIETQRVFRVVQSVDITRNVAPTIQQWEKHRPVVAAYHTALMSSLELVDPQVATRVREVIGALDSPDLKLLFSTPTSPAGLKGRYMIYLLQLA